jgi:hypothetical protein
MCVAFMPMHLVFVSAEGFKNAFRCCPNLSENFLYFLGVYYIFSLELNLFLRRLYNLSLELPIFYLDSSSCLKSENYLLTVIYS